MNARPWNALADRELHGYHGPDALSRADRVLTAEMTEALLQDPTREILVPGRRKATPAHEIVAEDLCGQSLIDLLRMVAGLAKKGDAQALEWIRARGAEFGAYHAADAVAGE